MRRRRQNFEEVGVGEHQLLMMSVVSAVLALFIVLTTLGRPASTKRNAVLTSAGRAFGATHSVTTPGPTTAGSIAIKDEIEIQPNTTNAHGVQEYYLRTDVIFAKNEPYVAAGAIERLARLLGSLRSRKVSVELIPLRSEILPDEIEQRLTRLNNLESALKSLEPAELHLRLHLAANDQHASIPTEGDLLLIQIHPGPNPAPLSSPSVGEGLP